MITLRGPIVRNVIACGFVVIAAIGTTGCSNLSHSGLVLKTVVQTVDPYFHGAGIDGTAFEKVADRVYTFRWNWYRNLVIDTDVGLVVIDPMNDRMAGALHEELGRRFPGKLVDTLIYSHYHLDHTRGGAVLAPRQVLAHEKCAFYWRTHDQRDIVAPTRWLSGDTVLEIGGVEIRALYLGLSHTDTLYAFHIPSARTVFTADLGLVRAVAPDGVPDRYAPGYLEALDRVARLDFDTFVPSHFGVGKRQDLVDWRDMTEEGRRLARDAVTRFGGPGVQEAQMGRYFDAVYRPMKEKYGQWHGFSEMFILNLVRDIVGEALGA